MRDIEKDEPFRVEITLNIDENNVVEVAARLKERPQVHLSKTLSRGKADEKLFMALEEAINEANRAQYTEYIMEDLLQRSLSVIGDIDRVIDPSMGEVDEVMYERALMKIEKARRLAAEDRVSSGAVNYGESVLMNFGLAIPMKDKENIRKKIKRLQEIDESGTYEENIKAIDDLQRAYKKLGIVNDLMEIKKAGDICVSAYPAKAAKFFRAIEDFMEAFARNDKEKALGIIDEIMPEAYDIVAEDESKSGTIYTDISR
jgi:molecular chaperone DnaK